MANTAEIFELQPTNEQEKKRTILHEISSLLAKHLDEDSVIHSPISNLVLARSSQPKPPLQMIHCPSLCITAQGAKSMAIGGEIFQYSQDSFLLITQTLPAAGTILKASPEKPYLGMLFKLDRQEVAEIALSLNANQHYQLPLGTKEQEKTSVASCEYSIELLDAIYRLVKLLETPQDIEFMAPVIKKEIIYRLLISPVGEVLAQMVISDSQNNRISKVITMIREQYNQPLSLTNLADQVHMSVSSLQNHFKTITQLSPLQFQKQIRLHEARRLMMTENMDAKTAGIKVGYNNQSQFNREYRRLFGFPPSTDIKQLKN
ncbi:MAG: AraC family transcriptional regulator N-terminal domain-containing protein [Vibrio sp.]